MRRLSVVFLVATFVAGCASSAGPSPTSPPATPATTPSTSFGPIATSTPQATPACPTDSPMSVDEYVAADPTCFGAADVQVAGWEGYPTGNESGLDNVQPAWLGGIPSDAGLRGHLQSDQCWPGCESIVLGVHLDPKRGLHFEDNSAWVVVTGHRQDPAAPTCAYVAPEEPDPAVTPPAQPDITTVCEEAFVATAITPTDPPAAALAGCPTTAVITVIEFKRSGEGCFHGKNLQIIGYADAMPYIDFGMVVGIKPRWIFFPQDPFAALWSEKPAGNVDIGPTCQDANENGPGTCEWMLVQYKPNSGVAFRPSHQWVIVTGHIADPVADTCKWDWPANWTDVKDSDANARRMCRDSFVMTGIRPTAAPAG